MRSFPLSVGFRTALFLFLLLLTTLLRLPAAGQRIVPDPGGESCKVTPECSTKPPRPHHLDLFPYRSLIFKLRSYRESDGWKEALFIGSEIGLKEQQKGVLEVCFSGLAQVVEPLEMGDIERKFFEAYAPIGP